MNVLSVGKDKKYETINDALTCLDYSLDNLIEIDDGIYEEKIKIINKSTNKIIIKGNGNVTIKYGDFAKKIHSDGKEFNTFRTYTMMLLGDNFTLDNITVINDAGKGEVVGQAVALSITGNNNFIKNSKLIANQDTLFLGPLPKDLIVRYQGFLKDDELVFPKKHRVYVTDSYIEGNIDFIFGSAEAYFVNDTIFSNGNGFVFAPSTDIDDEIGFVVINSIFKGSKNVETYLARPWRDYGMLYIINSKYENHILNIGFDKWNDTNRDKTCRFFEDNPIYFDNHKFRRCEFVKNGNLEIKNKIMTNLNKVGIKI